MSRHKETFVGWRPQYEGRRGIDGYEIAAEANGNGGGSNGNECKNALIISRSQRYERVGVRGSKATLYLDLINIRCGDLPENLTRFFNRWGDYYEGDDLQPREP